tara:strand:- start:31 stop:618 length:588 start_codon:yes stop_codon:yes gene_type:complete
MQRLLLILILTLSFQTLIKADDVRDLEIEGISLGDSLLEFFDEINIKKGIMDHNYADDSFFDVEIYDHKSFNKYQNVSFTLKKNDKKYKIYQIVGFNIYKTNIEKCLNQVDIISKNIADVLKDTDKVRETVSHEGDPTGKSKVKQIVYWHKTGSVFIECVDWSEKITKDKNWGDNLSVGMALSEYDIWLNTKAYD